MKEAIDRAFKEFVQDITGAHIAAGQQVSGKTIASLEIRNVSNTGGQLYGASYFGVLDAGRKAGKFPPIKPIMEWVVARGIDTQWKMTPKSAAFVIARKIAEFGTVLNRTGGRKDIIQDPYDRFVRKVSDAILIASVETVNKTFEKP